MRTFIPKAFSSGCSWIEAFPQAMTLLYLVVYEQASGPENEAHIGVFPDDVQLPALDGGMHVHLSVMVAEIHPILQTSVSCMIASIAARSVISLSFLRILSLPFHV